MTLRAPPDFEGAFRTDPVACALYSEGAGPYRVVPRAVAFPAHRDDAVALVRHAAAEGWHLTPRGAGTGMPGHNVGPSVVVDLAALDRPARVALAGTANVGAAVTCGVLNRVAGHFGLRLPPEPSSAPACTIGGMIATNAAGARSLRHGSMRSWVQGVELVTADGEVGWLPRAAARRTHRFPTPAERRELSERMAFEDRMQALQPRLDAARPDIDRRFPRTSKNSSGYALDAYLASGDLLDLVVGAEGTLGIVTRAEVRLERVPRAVGTLLVGLADLEPLADTVAALSAFDPAAMELLDRSFLELAGDTGAPVPLTGVRALLLVDIEGDDPDAVRQALRDAERTAAPLAATTASGMDDETRDTLWRIRHAASPALAALPDGRRSLQIVEDGCVPVERLGEYVAGVEAAAAETGVPVVMFGHAGDGHLHANALVDTTDPELEARLARLYEAVSALVLSLGGTPSGEHGDGRLRAPVVERLYGAEIVALFRAVKAAFDPDGIFNPGVIVSAQDPLDGLKVGPRAAPIPPEVAAALRDRERHGRWDRAPLTLLEGPE